MSDQDLICFCMSVTEGEIVSAVRAGSDSIAKLKRDLGCCTGCGTCEQRVKRLLVATLDNKDAFPSNKESVKKSDAA